MSGNNKAIVTLPRVILYKSHKKKTPLAIEITEIRKEPDYKFTASPGTWGTVTVQQLSSSNAQP